MRLFSLCLLTAFLQISLLNIIQAQNDTLSADYERVIRSSVIQPINPGGAGPQFSFEHPISDHHYLRYEAGWIPGYANSFFENVTRLTGFRLRTSLRSYEPYVKDARERWYEEFSLSYRAINLTVQDNFQLGMLPQFDQVLPYDLKLRSAGLSYLVGRTRDLGKQRRWQIDIGLGIGLRLNHRQYQSLPDGLRLDTSSEAIISIPSPWRYNHKEGYTLGLTVPVITALGYRF